MISRFAGVAVWALLFSLALLVCGVLPADSLTATARADKPAAAVPLLVTATGTQLSWQSVEEAILGALAERVHYTSGDLITRNDWQRVETAIVALGWTPRDASKIDALLLDDKAYLAKQLDSQAGRKFMRQVADYPLAYDKLDRLSGMPQGHDTIRRLIAGPDGYKLIEYLTEESGGKLLGSMLANTPSGGKFNQPTGRIYTQTALLARVQQSFVEAVAAQRSSRRKP